MLPTACRQHGCSLRPHRPLHLTATLLLILATFSGAVAPAAARDHRSHHHHHYRVFGSPYQPDWRP